MTRAIWGLLAASLGIGLAAGAILTDDGLGSLPLPGVRADPRVRPNATAVAATVSRGITFTLVTYRTGHDETCWEVSSDARGPTAAGWGFCGDELQEGDHLSTGIGGGWVSLPPDDPSMPPTSRDPGAWFTVLGGPVSERVIRVAAVTSDGAELTSMIPQNGGFVIALPGEEPGVSPVGRVDAYGADGSLLGSIET